MKIAKVELSSKQFDDSLLCFKGMSVLEKIRKIVQVPYMLLAFLLLKVVTYYILIDVNPFLHPLLLGTIFIFWIIFSHLSESKWKHKYAIFMIIYVGLSFLMFADSMYFNYYNQTVSVRQIYQVSNVAKVPQSFIATLIPASIFLIWDIPFASYYFRRKALEEKYAGIFTNFQKGVIEGILAAFILVCVINPGGTTFLTKINSVGFMTNHIKDIVDVAYQAVHHDFWEPQDVINVVEDANDTPDVTDNSPDIESLKGIGKDKNVIVIQLEAFQNFLINREYNGQVLTPNLNKLIGEESIYFDNYYSIIGKGNTADAEFATLNSLYPVIDGESYRLYTDNTYNGLPWKLKEQGYTTFAFHGNEATFWNRQAAYPYQGIDNFYSIETLDSSDIVGLGISDKSMFKQMVDVLSKQKGNFFSFGITLTSHHPYEMPKELQKLDILPEDEGSKFANYLQAVHYTDEAIGELIAELKEAGLYDNTILAFYGDHHGLNCTMDKNDEYVGRFLGKEYGYEEMLKVPCIIHIPGSKVTKTISTLGCQVDFLPTVSYLMDFKLEQPYIMGQNLLTAEHGYAAFTAYLFEGSFAYDDIIFDISREGIFEGSKAWKRDTLEEVDINDYEKQYEKMLGLKAASRQVLEQDLIADYVTHDVKVPDKDNKNQKTDKEKQAEANNEDRSK